MIVIPMAGLSRRFSDAGYKLPKYMLDLNGQSVFSCAVGSFSHYFKTLPFLFVARDVMGTGDFIKSECSKLGILNPRVKLLDAPTSGQAETVELGIADIADDTSLTIFNIDTFRPGFRFPDGEWFSTSDGYLEVFRGEGANWSYVRPAASDEPLALEAAEKRPISDLCCSGLYHFSRADLFRYALAQERLLPSATELYVAPIYNHLLRKCCRIHYELVEVRKVIFCGVPSEYEAMITDSKVVLEEHGGPCR